MTMKTTGTTSTKEDSLIAHGGVRVYIRTPSEQYDAVVSDLLNRIADFSIEWELDVSEYGDVLVVDVRDADDIRQWADGSLPHVEDAHVEPNYISFKRREQDDV